MTAAWEFEGSSEFCRVLGRGFQQWKRLSLDGSVLVFAKTWPQPAVLFTVLDDFVNTVCCLPDDLLADVSQAG